MEKRAIEKTIRRAVVAAVALLFFGSTLVVGNTLKVMIFGEPTPPAADEIAVSLPASKKSISKKNRSLASVPVRMREPGYSGESYTELSRESPGVAAPPGEWAVNAENESTFAENFAEFLGTGEWPASESEATKRADSSSNPSSGSTFVAGGSGGGGESSPTILSTADSGGGVIGDITPVPPPVINVQPPFFASSPTAGMNGVVGGYTVSVTAAGSLSAVHGTTADGYSVWLNEAAQQASP